MPTGSPELCIRIVHHASRTSIVVEGELDLANTSVLHSHLDCVITDAPGDVELHLADVTYIDSTGLAEILDASSTLLDLGRDLRVTTASAIVVRLFDLCGITHLLADSPPPPVQSSTIASASPPGDAAARPVLTPIRGRAAS